MTFSPLVEHMLGIILRCGGKLDLTSDDLWMSLTSKGVCQILEEAVVNHKHNVVPRSFQGQNGKKIVKISIFYPFQHYLCCSHLLHRTGLEMFYIRYIFHGHIKILRAV